MILATSTGDFANYLPAMEQQLAALAEAGFRHIDLSFYREKADSRFMQPDWQHSVSSLAHTAAALGLDFVQCHLPDVNPLHCTAQDVEVTVRCLQVCGLLGIPLAVAHIGWAPELTVPQHLQANRAYFEQLYPAVEAAGVTLCLENSTRVNMGDMYYPHTGEQLREFVLGLGHPQLAACWDTGHGNCEGEQYSQLLALGPLLKAVHINDNHGGKDEHLMPYFGTVNMDEIMHGLLDAGFAGPFTFEASECLNLPAGVHWPRRPYPADTRLAAPPLFMQQALEALQYRLGEHILKAYGCFEA